MYVLAKERPKLLKIYFYHFDPRSSLSQILSIHCNGMNWVLISANHNGLFSQNSVQFLFCVMMLIYSYKNFPSIVILILLSQQLLLY